MFTTSFSKNNHIDKEFIDEFTEGWDVMPSFLEDYTLEKVSEITGLSEDEIKKAAEFIGTTKNWMTCWTMGLNQSTHGTWNTITFVIYIWLQELFVN